VDGKPPTHVVKLQHQTFCRSVTQKQPSRFIRHVGVRFAHRSGVSADGAVQKQLDKLRLTAFSVNAPTQRRFQLLRRRWRNATNEANGQGVVFDGAFVNGEVGVKVRHRRDAMPQGDFAGKPKGFPLLGKRRLDERFKEADGVVGKQAVGLPIGLEDEGVLGR
jgi:hypothetical protein